MVGACGGGVKCILVTVAILAQGTSWAVAVTQASFAEVRKRVFAQGQPRVAKINFSVSVRVCLRPRCILNSSGARIGRRSGVEWRTFRTLQRKLHFILAQYPTTAGRA